MWNAKTPSRKSLEFFSEAFPTISGVCSLGDDREFIAGLYESYDRAKGIPAVILQGNELSLESRNMIHDAYDLTYKSRRLNHIRKELNKLTFKCVYCGFGELSELDHYLPRSIYKAHAIHLNNLIPCCHVCNHIKSISNSSDASSQYLHAYYHLLPETTILDAALNTFNGGFSIDFSIVGYVFNEPKNIMRARYQFHQLNLNDRYEQEAISMISNLMVGLNSAFGQGPQELRAHLATGYLKSLKNENFGANHWQTAIWRSLFLSPSLYEIGPQSTLNL
ncbi:HNH endonuclease [Pseudomonas syringae]|uniref:HNH endonuclease n=1 Tax=Pseudomonas syringae TaxID=317 RepID=UPI003F76AB33